MVESTLRTAMRSMGADIRLESVWASNGKHQRAEPIAALYEQKRFHHVGTFPELEDELYRTEHTRRHCDVIVENPLPAIDGAGAGDIRLRVQLRAGRR